MDLGGSRAKARTRSLAWLEQRVLRRASLSKLHARGEQPPRTALEAPRSLIESGLVALCHALWREVTTLVAGEPGGATGKFTRIG